jgi:hypothetical protein
MLHKKYLCSRHFLESDFTPAERAHLNKVAVPCRSDSVSQTLSQPPVPSLYTPSLNPLPSVITHKDYTDVVFPTTYSKTLVPSQVTHIPSHAHGPSTSFKISAEQPLPTPANTFAVKETLFPQAL